MTSPFYLSSTPASDLGEYVVQEHQPDWNQTWLYPLLPKATLAIYATRIVLHYPQSFGKELCDVLKPFKNGKMVQLCELFY